MKKCNNCNSYCNTRCIKETVTRQIRLENNSIGRDGESAYEAYVRLGGNLSEKDWIASLKGDKGEGNPDNEDITEILEGSENVLKFKDRVFIENDLDGLGYRYVRKDINRSINVESLLDLTGINIDGYKTASFKIGDDIFTENVSINSKSQFLVSFGKDVLHELKNSNGEISTLSVGSEAGLIDTNEYFTYYTVKRGENTTDPGAIFYTSGKGYFLVQVKGLSFGDSVRLGTGAIAPSSDDIVEDGLYIINCPDNVTRGLKLYGNPSNKNEVFFKVVSVYEYEDVDEEYTISIEFDDFSETINISPNESIGSIKDRFKNIGIPNVTFEDIGSSQILVTCDYFGNNNDLYVSSSIKNTKVNTITDGSNQEGLIDVLNRFSSIDYFDYFLKTDLEVVSVSTKRLGISNKLNAFEFYLGDTKIRESNVFTKKVEEYNSIFNQLIESDTIYEIRYDYDLNQKTLVIPDNSVLKFNGGSIRNGTIILNNTKIDSDLNFIFKDVVFKGSLVNSEVYAEWFGAVPFKINSDIIMNPETVEVDIDNRVDSTKAIQSSLDLGFISGATVKCTQGFYKTTDTIYIKDYTTLEFSSKGGLVPVMSGSGKMSIMGGNKVRMVRYDEYVPTSGMKSVVNMTSKGARLIGHGFILTKFCKFTIGLLIEGIGFRGTDMTFRTMFDVVVVDDTWGQTVPDIDDLWSIGVPDNSLGGNDDYCIDSVEGMMYKKTNGKWNRYKRVDFTFGVGIRLEAANHDNRIINIDANAWLQFGFRGIEFINHGEVGSGGWINDSEWRGTISNKSGNFTSFFGKYDFQRHDFSQMDYQTSDEMSADCKIVYGNPKFCKFGYTWDLNWSAWSFKKLGGVKYEFTRGSMGNYIEIDAERYLRDYGTRNDFSISPYYLDKNSIISKGYYNILEGSSPFSSGMTHQDYYKSFNEIMLNNEDVFNLLPTTDNSWHITSMPPKELFDGDPTSSVIVCDSLNNIYGSVLRINTTDGASSPVQHLYNNRYLSIEYSLNGNVNGGNSEYKEDLYKFLVKTDNVIREYNLKYFGQLTVWNTRYGTQRITLKLDTFRNLAIAFKTNEVTNTTLKIHSIEVYNSSRGVSHVKSNKHIDFPSTAGYANYSRELDFLATKELGSRIIDSKTKLPFTNIQKDNIDGFIPDAVHKMYNILKYRSPINARITPTLNIVHYDTSDDILSTLAEWGNVGSNDIPLNVFDEKSEGSFKVIDPSNNIMATKFNLYNNMMVNSNMAVIEVSYFITGPNSNNTDFNLVVGHSSFDKTTTDGRGRYIKEFSLKNNMFGISNNIPSQNRVLMRLGRTDTTHQARSLLFYSKTNSVDNTLVITGIKLFVEKGGEIRDLISGTTQFRPNACIKGHIYYDTTLNSTFINIGDSTNVVWEEIPKQTLGDWNIPSTGVYSLSSKYSVIGKQMSIGGEFLFTNDYVLDSEITVVLPSAPDYGGVIQSGNITLTLTKNSTNLKVKSSFKGGVPQSFQLNYKTR